MPGFVHFLRCVGKAAVKHGLRALAGLVPMGGELYDIASAALSEYLGDCRDEQLRAEIQALDQASPAEQLRAEIQALDQASPAETKQVAEQVVREVAADQPPEVQIALTSYLRQVQATVRQSLHRSAEPAGTPVPASLAMNKPEDLLPFLPARLPRFKPGDCPPGVGDWELVELLGTGGFGEVWKAHNPQFDGVLPVALKFCLDAAAKDDLLKHEAAILNTILRVGKHRGIVQLQHTYLRANPPCLQYELVEGGDLAGLMQEQMAKGGASAQFAAQIIHRLAKTVAFAHGLNPPIVHRDLKPANILVQRKPDGKVTLLVADFGIGGIAAAQVMRQESGQPKSREQSLWSAVRGAFTPLYASPQQRRGDRPDPRDDIHALGVMWYQFLIGDLTAERPSGQSWRKKLENRGMAPGLIDLLESCMEDDPNERPANAENLAARIEQLLHPEKGTALPKEIINSLGMKLVLVPRGTFWMGDRGSQTQVEVPQDFYMGAFPVTQWQWQAIMGSNPSYFSRTGRGADKVKAISDADLKQFPVEQVTWDNAQEFLKRLNAREKDSGWLYRLPIEAEWEYACRGGATSQDDCAFDFYLSQPTNDFRPGQGNCGNSLGRTTTVGSYQPNRLGIYDMHGNVGEWCEDEDHFESGALARAFRGGSWRLDGSICRASSHFGGGLSARTSDLGFRLAAVPSGE